MHIIFYSTWYSESRNFPECQNVIPLSPHSFSGGPCVSVHSPQPWSMCYIHCSRLFELPITLHWARRLGAFEFAQPTPQSLGSCHLMLLDFDFGIIFHTDFQRWTVALSKPTATRLVLRIYIAFPQLHHSNHLGGESRDLWVHWVPPVLCSCCPGALFTEISQFCVSFQATSARAFLLNFSGEGW